MARIQTRRTVSMSREAYDKIRAHSEAVGMSMSQIIEEWVAALPQPETKK